MKILLSILLLFSFAAKSQDTTKYMPMSAKGYKFNGGTFKNIWIGQDTTNYKTGIVRIGFRFFVGNGVYWKEIAGGSSAPSGLTGAVVTQIDSTRFNVSPGSYYIQGSLYANGDTTFNLAQPGDTSRIDVIGLDTLGQVFTITGVESENPYPSSIDPLSQIYLSFVWVDTDTVYFAPTPVNYWSALGNDIIPNNPGKVQFKNGLYVDQITANDSRLFTDKQLILQSNRPTGSKIFAGISGGNVDLNTTELQLSLGDNSTTGTAKTALSLTGGSLHASGTEEMNMISITPSIVQSGSYSGSVRGIYYNPTVTSNVGSHYAFESTAGRIKFGGTPSVNDTTSKPVVMDGSGNLSRLNYWPTGSGGGGGVDSSAYWTASVLSDSTGFILCDRRGRCDTIISTERASSIDSIRRIAGSTNVQARKGGVWVTQYQDSVGSGGGGSQNLDQVLAVGNNTDTTINFVDTLSSNEGKQFVTIYPKGYGQTGYPNGRPAMFSGLGYHRYPGVNADGRPNVVGLLWGYNGGFNNKVIAGEPTWGVRTETWYQISGAANSEFHGVSPEFQPINGTASRRLGTWYVRNSDGYSTFTSQGNQYGWYHGATDTAMLSLGSTGMLFGSKGVGSFTIKNQDSATNNTSISLNLNGTSFSNTVSAGAQPLNSFAFFSPITVSPGTSYGSSSTYLGLVNTTVALANKYGFSVISSGITTTNFGGLTIDGNTTGTITPLYGRNTSATGTVSSVMIGGNGSTAAWMLRDNSIGIDWRMYLKSGDAERQMKIGFGTSTYDSLMKFRGTDGKVSIRTSLNVGAAAYPVASAALEVTSTTQGFLPPRMTATQASAISSPAEGLLVYVTDTKGTFTAKGWWGWDGAAWQKLNN